MSVLGSAEGSLDGDGGGAAPPPEVGQTELELPHTLLLLPGPHATNPLQQLLQAGVLAQGIPSAVPPGVTEHATGAGLGIADIDGWKLGATEGTEVGSGYKI